MKKKKKMKLKRFLAGLVAVCMLMTMVPTAAFAEGEIPAPAAVAEQRATPEQEAAPAPDTDAREQMATDEQAGTPAPDTDKQADTPAPDTDAVAKVRTLFAVLPQSLTAEEWQAMTEEEQAALYDQLEAAGLAYDALAEEKKEPLAEVYAQWIAMVATVQQASDVALLAVEPHTHDDGVTFDKELTAEAMMLGGKLSTGNYYLTGNLDIDYTIDIDGEDVKICLNGYTITTDNTSGDGVFSVMGDSGKLTLYDCKGTGKLTHAAGRDGPGVFVGYSCTFTMYGGTIAGNTGLYDQGGGIYNEGTVIINGGTITKNHADDAGGIYNNGTYSTATVTINGGTIDGNTADSDGGGIYNVSGEVTIGGNSEIASNNASTSGGGIYNDEGTVTITDESMIYYNQAPSGGGIFNFIGSVEVKGGLIQQNTVSEFGGGIYNNGSRSTLTITGGDIFSNTAGTSGGGIYVKTGKATINGGRIYDNKAPSGGGIYNEGGTLTLNGATITDNSASNGTGGGVLAKGTVTLSGKNVIKPQNGGNLYVPTGSYLTIGGAVTGNVYIDTEVDPADGTPVVFAKPVTGYTIIDADVGAFESSDDGWVIKKNSDGNLEHAVAAPVITKDDFTYTAPSDLYYTGTAKAATVTANVTATAAGVGTLTVTYYDTNGTAATPASEGTYTVKITDANGIVTDLEVGSFTITRITSANGASVSGTTGTNGWYTGDVTITPPTGWMISATDTTDTTAWLDKLTQKDDGESITVIYYLKDDNGHITDSKTTGTIKKDATKPDITAAAASYITDTTAKLRIDAYDKTSRIFTYSYALKGTDKTGNKVNDLGSCLFDLTGLTANTEYTATVTVTDNAGNQQTKDVTFTTKKEPIDTVAVTITAPVKGATPDTVATVASDAPYTAGAVTWSSTPTVFMGGTIYRATVYLTPAAGYEFNYSTTATIPGVDGTTYARPQENGTLQVYGDFPETAAPVLEKIDVYDYKKTTYEATDKFDPTGLKLLLTNDDGSTSIVAYGDDNKDDFAFSPETITMDTDKVTITHSGKTTTLNVSVTKKEVEAPTIAAKAYTGSLLKADVADTALYTVTTNDGGTDAGNYEVKLTLEDTNSYKWKGTTKKTITLTFTIDKVAPAELRITGQQTKAPIYGDSFTLGTTGGSGDGKVSWEATEGLATVDANGKVTVTGVGAVTITATKAADKNHTRPESDSYVFSSQKAKLTVTAADQKLAYGDVLTGCSVTYEGWKNGDSEDDLGGKLSYTTDYTPTSPVYSYNLIPTGLRSDNYTFTYVYGILTVKQRVVTLSWNNTATRAYDGVASNVTATAGNLANSEAMTVTVTGGTETNIGNHTATATGLEGDTASNYKLPETVRQSYKIVKSATDITEVLTNQDSYIYGEIITVTANVKATGEAPAPTSLLARAAIPMANQVALYYGETQISEPVSVTVPGNSITLTYDTASKTLPIGITTLTLKYVGTANLANATNTVNVTITPKAVTAEVTGGTNKTYDTTNTATVALGVKTMDLVDEEDTVTVMAPATYNDANVGTGKAITFGTMTTGGEQSSYYAVTLPTSVTGAITTKNVTTDLTLAQETYEYDGTAKTPNVTVKDGENTIPAAEYTVEYTANTAAGTATVTVKDAADGNYNVTGTTTFTITKKALYWDLRELLVNTQKHFDGNDAATFTGTLKATGEVAGDTPGFAYKELSVRYAAATAGKHTITVTPVDLVMTNANYSLPTELPTYEGTIAPAEPGAPQPYLPIVPGENYRIMLESGITQVPATLAATPFNTPAAIMDEMLRITNTHNGYSSERSVVYDVVLQVSKDGGASWADATPENFPAEVLTVVLAYPAGTAANTHDFIVNHMITTTVNGAVPGTIDTPEVTETAEGLKVKLIGLSPVSIAWKSTGSSNESGNDKDASDSKDIPDSKATSDSKATPDSKATSASKNALHSPETGDASPVSVLVVVLLCSALVLASLTYIAHKKRRSMK